MSGRAITRARKEHEAIVFDAPAAIDGLCDEIAEGLGMAGWCGKLGVRYRACVAWVMSDPERSRLVDDAQRARARYAAEAGEALGRKLAAPDVRTGVEWIDDGPPVLEAKAARVALDAFKFASSTGDRERFGRSVQHNHTHRMQADHLQALKRRNDGAGPARSVSPPDALREVPARAREAAAIDVEWRALPDTQPIDVINNALRLPAIPCEV